RRGDRYLGLSGRDDLDLAGPRDQRKSAARIHRAPSSTMNKLTDVQVRGATLYLLPMRARIPLKFGPETLTEVTCARVNLRVADRRGAVAEGWGETPLSVQWVWPSQLSYQH